MKYLKNLKHIDDLGWLSLATASKKDVVSTLKSIEPALRKRYKSYDSEIIKYKACPTDTDFPCEADRDVLIEFYEKPPKKLNEELKNRRTKHELKDCPFCGNPLKPLTLDHFIPKSIWPDYSILPNNLIPQCKSCAPIKGEKYYDDKTSKSFFINPIYSDLLERIRLKIEIDFKEDDNQFDFKIRFLTDEKITKNELERLKSHLETLKVKSRILVYCKTTVSELINDCKAKKFDLKMVLKARKEERFINDDSVRDWQTALFLGLLANDYFLIYLTSLMPTKRASSQKAKLTKVIDI